MYAISYTEMRKIKSHKRVSILRTQYFESIQKNLHKSFSNVCVNWQSCFDLQLLVLPTFIAFL